MNCPKCGCDALKCKDSRHKNGAIYRRKECTACGYRFGTLEVIVEHLSLIKDKETLVADIVRLKEKEAFLHDILNRAREIDRKLLEMGNSGGKYYG